MDGSDEKIDFQACMKALLEDDTAHEAREQFLTVVTDAFTKSAEALNVGGWLLKNRSLEALAILTQMVAELADGALTLLRKQEYYAAAALVRQLVEGQYFMWRFSVDDGAGAEWLAATSEQIRHEFSPSQLRRQAGDQFNAKEYWHHCDVGGHPNPKARIVLKQYGTPLGTHRFLWVDLAQHLETIWQHFETALTTNDVPPVVVDQLIHGVRDATEQWHEKDVLWEKLSRSMLESL